METIKKLQAGKLAEANGHREEEAQRQDHRTDDFLFPCDRIDVTGLSIGFFESKRLDREVRTASRAVVPPVDERPRILERERILSGSLQFHTADGC